jgi:hypothetical protein
VELTRVQTLKALPIATTINSRTDPSRANIKRAKQFVNSSMVAVDKALIKICGPDADDCVRLCKAQAASTLSG